MLSHWSGGKSGHPGQRRIFLTTRAHWGRCPARMKLRVCCLPSVHVSAFHLHCPPIPLSSHWPQQSHQTASSLSLRQCLLLGCAWCTPPMHVFHEGCTFSSILTLPCGCIMFSFHFMAMLDGCPSLMLLTYLTYIRTSISRFGTIMYKPLSSISRPKQPPENFSLVLLVFPHKSHQTAPDPLLVPWAAIWVTLDPLLVPCTIAQDLSVTSLQLSSTGIP